MRTDAATLRRVAADAQLEIALRALTVGTKATPSPSSLDEIRETLLEISEADVLPPMLRRRLLDALRLIGQPPEHESFSKLFSKAFRPAAKIRSPPRRRSLLSEGQGQAVRSGDDWREQRPRVDSPRPWGPEDAAEAKSSREFRERLEKLVSRTPMKSSFREALEEIARKARRRRKR